MRFLFSHRLLRLIIERGDLFLGFNTIVTYSMHQIGHVSIFLNKSISGVVTIYGTFPLSHSHLQLVLRFAPYTMATDCISESDCFFYWYVARGTVVYTSYFTLLLLFLLLFKALYFILLILNIFICSYLLQAGEDFCSCAF